MTLVSETEFVSSLVVPFVLFDSASTFLGPYHISATAQRISKFHLHVWKQRTACRSFQMMDHIFLGRRSHNETHNVKVFSSSERLVALARMQQQQLRKISKNSSPVARTALAQPRASAHLHQPPQLSLFKHQRRGVEWGRQQSAQGIATYRKRVQGHQTRASGGKDPGKGVGLRLRSDLLQYRDATCDAKRYIFACKLQ
jgi:hypothetical protein